MKLLLVIFAFCVAGCYLVLMLLGAIFNDISVVGEFILMVLPFVLAAVIYCHLRTMEKLRQIGEKLQRLMTEEKDETE